MRLIREQLKVLWMDQAIEWLDGESISEQLKDRWMDQGSIEGMMDAASGGWINSCYVYFNLLKLMLVTFTC